jgi:acetoin utilization protein AcuB
MTTTLEIMSDRLVTVSSDDYLKNAYKVMQEKGIRHLPVTAASGKIVGIISDRDLKLAMVKMNDYNDETYYQFNSDEKVMDYMSTPIMMVHGTDQVEAVAKRMLLEKVSAFLVIDHHQHVAGIITTDDLLSYLVLILEQDKYKDQVTIFHLLNQA